MKKPCRHIFGRFLALINTWALMYERKLAIGLLTFVNRSTKKLQQNNVMTDNIFPRILRLLDGISLGADSLKISFQFGRLQ